MKNLNMNPELRLAPRPAKFFMFVKEQHGDQKRKYTNEPYWHHLAFVASVVQQKVKDHGLLIEVALGHDLYEDTKCGSGDLRRFMRSAGYTREEQDFIDKGIESLTDFYTPGLYPELNRKERKRREVKRMAGIDGVYQSVKYADLIHNTQSIAMFDHKFAEVYLKEKRWLLDYIDKGDRDLHLEAYKILKEAEEHINNNPESPKPPVKIDKVVLFGVEVPVHKVDRSAQRFSLPKVEIKFPNGVASIVLHNHFDDRIEMMVYYKSSKHSILWDKEGLSISAEHRILRIIEDYEKA